MKFLLLALVLSLASCAFRSEPAPAPPTASFLTTSDGKQLSLRHWNHQRNPETVVIALHGIAGAAVDFRILGKTLSKQSPRTSLYALNLRGLGYDDEATARGDMADSDLWLRDLEELHCSLSTKYPAARILWLGESMGGIIALHTAARGSDPPDGLIIASPVMSLASVPRWQRSALTLASGIAPRARLSLEALAGGDFEATSSTDHFSQSETNPYHIDRFTLRFIDSLATMAGEMSAKARETNLPVLILQGGKDFLSRPADGAKFAGQFRGPTRHRVFPESHHLLFYDKERLEVISQIQDWL